MSRSPTDREDLLRLLIDSVSDYAIFALDAEGNVSSWNPGAQRFKGYEADEIIGKHFSTFYTDEDITSGKPAWILRQAIDHGRVEDEGWRVRKDGSRFWADVVITSLWDETGELRGFAKVTRDLTDRKKNEDAVKDALEREKAAAEHLRQLDEMKNEFVAMVAHDLRSPVSVVSGFAETLVHRWADFSDEQKLAIVERIGNSAVRLTNLINDVLDVSRIEAGELRYQMEDLDLVELVNDAVDKDFSGEDQERIVVLADADIPKVLADEQRTWQVLANLLSNAIKFSPSNSRIEVRIEQRGGMVEVGVKDRGPGIPAELLPKVFDRFRKLPGATTSKGTGLGLYIAKAIVEAQGGTLKIDSVVGNGSTFRFGLPISKG